MKHFFLQHFYICVLILRVLSSILVLAGIYLLARGYRMLRKSFNGTLLLEIPLTESAGNFEILQAGLYAIWQKGELLRRRPIETIRPYILEGGTGVEIPLLQSLSDKRLSNNTQSRIEIYTFQALAGPHKLVIESGLPLAKLNAYMEGVFPLPADSATHFLQVRESQPGGRSLLSVPVMLLGVAMIVGGIFLISIVEWVVRL